MGWVGELVQEPALRRLASPGGYRQGVALAVSGCVELVSFEPARVTGRVEDPVFEHVELRAASNGLRWSCTCPEGSGRTLCRHSVAVAHLAWQRSPTPPAKPTLP
jgi:uncharacterized Zn finger protein